MRYVLRIGTKQSSAGSVTYVSVVPTTGLLRTCNILRISHLPVLRNDGAGEASLAPTQRTVSLPPSPILLSEPPRPPGLFLLLD
ncbi:MAG: hypothetical protein LBM98_12755 [Oscillospiraceae bacterium]|nr:hypothetical protein [Oscillospiraceae bacterium]